MYEREEENKDTEIRIKGMKDITITQLIIIEKKYKQILMTWK